MNTRRDDLERLASLTQEGQVIPPAGVTSTGPPPPGDEGFTATWCTEALRDSGVLGGASVVAVRESPLGPDTPGFFGVLSRLHLEYDEADAGPATVVAKRSSPEEFNRAIASSMGFYEREFHVYRELADAIPLRMPEHYYSALDGDRFVLLMQDLDGARVGRQSHAASVSDIEAVVDEAAILHGRFFEAPELDLEWIRPIDANAAVYDAAFESRWAGFLERSSAAVRPEAIEAGQQLVGRVHEVVARLAQGPVTMTHGDYRIDNVMFDVPPEQDRPLIIDWQAVGRGQGAFDVAQIISLSLEPSVRRQVERALLDRYAERVETITGSEISRADLYEAYRVALLFPFAVGVAQTDMDTDQQGSDVGVWVARAAEAVADNGLPDWLRA